MKDYPFKVVSLVTQFCRFLQDLEDEKCPKRKPGQALGSASFLPHELTLLCQFKKLITSMSYSHGSNR